VYNNAEGDGMPDNTEKISTRQKILFSAADLFAMKGYTETTLRELADAVGVKASSLYNHFESKNAILEYMLEDYAAQNAGPKMREQAIYAKLKEDPTAEGIISCLRLSFPVGMVDYYTKLLGVILQEQFRNPIVRKFVIEDIFTNSENVVKQIVNTLIILKKLRADEDADFWAKMHSSLLYTFSSRFMLGIGDNSPEFFGLTLTDMLKNMYDLLLKTRGIENGGGLAVCDRQEPEARSQEPA
jgi:AcrR family transcriptional regulator